MSITLPTTRFAQVVVILSCLLFSTYAVTSLYADLTQRSIGWNVVVQVQPLTSVELQQLADQGWELRLCVTQGANYHFYFVQRD